MNRMEIINYFDRKDYISNSYMSHFENVLLNRSKGKKFREFSWANFVGSQVHLAMETNGESLSNLVVGVDLPKLSPNQVIVLSKTRAGMTIEDAVRDTYKVGIDKQIEDFKTLIELFNQANTFGEDTISISAERLKWGYLDNEKCDDERTLFIIKKAYEVISNELHQIHNSYSPYAIHKEEEIYWTDKRTGLKCKGKPDHFIMFKEHHCFEEEELIDVTWLFDFKIGSGEIHTKIRDRRYLRQLSFYCEAILQKFGVGVSRFTIMYFNIDTLQLEYIDISPNDIMRAKDGGYYTPEWFTQERGMFCNASQLESLKWVGFWEIPNPKYKVLGWRELLDELCKHNEGTQFFEDMFSSPRLADISSLLEDDTILPF